MQSVTGYRFDLEDLNSLQTSAIDISHLYRNSEIVPYDPSTWMIIENQLKFGSCAGHAFTTCRENSFYLVERGYYPQFSRRYAYVKGQKSAGISGDNGCTIHGVIEAGKRFGTPLENQFPYWSQNDSYNNFIPSAVDELAAKFKLIKHTDLTAKDYEDIVGHLNLKQGGVIFGGPFDTRNTPVIQRWSGSVQAMHAYSYVGISTRKDTKGRHYLIEANSWGQQWGIKGFREVSPDAINDALQLKYMVAAGLYHDKETIEQYDFLNVGIF